MDASYLTHPDSKSHTGYCLSFGEIGTFYSKSQKQSAVATSSTHAEGRTLYSLVIDIVYLIYLCEELGRPIDLPAIVTEDNQPIIDVSSDMSKRTRKCKHFLMILNYVREQVELGFIELRKIGTKENFIDVLTKIVIGRQFHLQAAALRGDYPDAQDEE